jgi:hypothetical protein
MNKLKFLIVAMGLILFSLPALAQEESEDGGAGVAGSKYGSDSATCVTNLSLYREFFNQWKAGKYSDNHLAEQSLASWRYCFFNCPVASKNMYLHGERLINNYITEYQNDSVKKQAYVDTLMMIYDQRIKYYGNDPKAPASVVLGRKAQDWMKYRQDQSKVYYPMFLESFYKTGNESEPATLYSYYVATIYYVKQGNADRDLILENYVAIEDVIDFNLNRYAGDEKKMEPYTKIANNIEKSVSQFANCEKLIELYDPKLKANPNDLKLAKNIVKFLEKRKCTKSDLYFSALEKVHAKEPSAETAFLMGKMALEREQFVKAKDYLLEATNKLPDTLVTKKASAYLLLAETSRSLGQYSSARTAAIKVLNYNPNEVMVFILIGDLYSAAASDCLLQGLRVSYWAAADKYIKAINMTNDEKIKDLAQKKLAAVQRSFPEKQDIFMRSLTEGQTITIECWIGESTTIRARD